MRTFTRSELDRARQAWDEGDFSEEWRPFRHLAAQGGLIFPPSGSKWDTWDDDEPSQRAIVIRAIRETPTLLRRCIVGAGSWSVVVRRLLAERDSDRERVTLAERDAAWERRQDTAPQAVRRLGDIIALIRDSV